jgi:hypothetical protein
VTTTASLCGHVHVCYVTSYHVVFSLFARHSPPCLPTSRRFVPCLSAAHPPSARPPGFPFLPAAGGGGGGGDAKGVDLLSVIVVDNQMLVNRRKNCYVRRGYGLKKMSEGYEGSKEEI